jgi:hypothetical protein
MARYAKRRRASDATTPFSIRLTAEEKTRLEDKANGVPLGLFIRDVVLDDAVKPRIVRQSFRVQDREAFARVLALLGRSKIADSLSRLADAADDGCLPVDDEVRAALKRGCDDIRSIRLLLMTAVGMKVKPEWQPEERLAQTFDRVVGRVWE